MAINHKLDIEEIELVEHVYGKTGKESLTVFDVGTNRGLYIDMFLEKPVKSRIHSFEPIQSLYGELEKKYGSKENVFLNKLCVSDSVGEVTFHELLNPETDGCSSMIERPVFKQRNWPYRTYIINSVRIDDYCEDNNIDYIDFLKIDVEGAEFLVILGCEKMLKRGAIHTIQFEYGNTFDDANVKLMDVFNLIKTHGYKMFMYQNKKFNEITLDNINEFSKMPICNFVIKKSN